MTKLGEQITILSIFKDYPVALVQRLTHSFRQDEIKQKWFIVDANGKTLGRIASRVAHVLRGKHKPTFTTNIDAGDFVIVINADKVKVQGRRQELKTYFSHTGYPGGATVREFKELIKTNPERVVTHAVKGMIPHNRLGARVIKKLKVYKGTEHPHKAQKPEMLNI
ncbi:MAG: 50S ribosomal protein L13 [Ignavibacteriae bacterium]|nr:50S ribosomal protein L13 [Ignavibacteria bacterium]MBI3364257.1 50S ribosomal protein L13 [Ignavibacteriota bacterium]